MVAQEMTTIRGRGPILVSIVALAALLRPAPAVADGGGYKFRGSFARLDGSTAAGLLHATIGGSGSSMVVRARGLGDSASLSLLLREAGAGDTAVVTFTSNVRGRAFEKRDFTLNGDLLGRFQFTAAGREMVNGRPMLMLDFKPANKKLPERTLKDKFINKAAGRVWVDEAAPGRSGGPFGS